MELELKKWQEYTKNEKKKLLLHWWHYYSNILYSIEEFKTFIFMIEEDQDLAFEIAVASHVYNMSTEPIINAIRENCLDELKETFPRINKQEEKTKKAYERVENILLKRIVKSYNNQGPIISLWDTIDLYNKNSNIEKTNKNRRYRNINS